MSDTPPAATSGPDLNRLPFVMTAPDRLIGKGHAAGDFLEAYDWVVTEESHGHLAIRAHLPDHARNPRGQLFGGFTPTYVDLVALFTVRAGPDRLNPDAPRHWLATTNMRIDYFEPITGPMFTITSTVEKRRGRTVFVTTRFFQGDELAVHAVTTMRLIDTPTNPLGDA
ncbi:MAG: PaaI family thioesterase [Acidimicrobiales bacterium]